MTICTCCFAEDLANAWPYLNKRVTSLIKKELEEAVKEQNFEKAIELRDKLKDLEK